MHDIQYTLGIFKQLITGLPVTLTFVLASWIIGFFLAGIVTTARLSRFKVVELLFDIYVSFARSVPIVLQLFLMYYGLPVLMQAAFGVDINGISKMFFCVITFALYYGAYLSEILRPAYLSVKGEQHDAANGLGYTEFQANYHVIIPQMISTALPSLGNEVINLIHQSSILFVLGTVDLMGQADMIVSTDYTSSPLLTYFCAGIIYWVLTGIATISVNRIEHRIDRYKLGGNDG